MPRRSKPVSDLETLRLLTFLDDLHGPYHELFPLAEDDATWNIVATLFRSHLQGEAVAISALAAAAQVPYTTALRRIEAMISGGLILRQSDGHTKRATHLVPSERLIERLLDYLSRVKALLARVVGHRPIAESVNDYYFGGVLPDGTATTEEVPRLRFLVDDDNYFDAMRHHWSDFRSNLGSQQDFDLVALPDLYASVVRNAGLPRSQYDVVAVNLPWLAEFAERAVVRSIDDLHPGSGISATTFHPRVWRSGQWDGKQFAVPIYSTVEALAYRKDLFDARELTGPRTFDKVIETGLIFHQPSRGRYGMVWNAGRGMPIASAFQFLLSCCGRSVRTVLSTYAQGDIDDVVIDLDAGAMVLDYMRRLLEISPAGVLDLDWESSLQIFMEGRAAMTYCWTMRAARFEYDVKSRVRNKVAYVPHPAGPGGRVQAPLGGFLLAIPANLPEERVRPAMQAIAWMTSPDTMRGYAGDGYPVLPHFSVAADPEMMRSSGVAKFVERMGRQHLLNPDCRPVIPQYHRLETILGEEVHAALSGEKSDRDALRAIERRLRAISTNGVARQSAAAGSRTR